MVLYDFNNKNLENGKPKCCICDSECAIEISKFVPAELFIFHTYIPTILFL